MAPEMDRRTFISLAALAGMNANVKAISATEKSRPNILIIMSDQHTPNVLGCYGNNIVKTPNLDRLASRGALFEHAYCQAPLCVPSRTSFMTGLQPSQNRIWGNDDCLWLSSGAPTFAHALGAAGYDTTLIGRMHFGGVDQWHGFKTRLVGDPMNPYTDRQYALSESLAPGASATGRSITGYSGPGKTAYQAFDRDVTNATVKYLHEVGNKQQPFLAVAGFTLPHSPYVCSPDDYKYYSDRVALPMVPPGFSERLHPALKEWLKFRGLEDVPRDQARRALISYYGLVSELDRNVGKILDALETSGLAQDTCVIYTSDHGDMAGLKGMWGKFLFLDGSVTVPLLLSCPTGFLRDTKLPQVVSLVDVAPTLCELAETDTMPNASGRSLVPLLRAGQTGLWNNPGALWPNKAFSELAQVGPLPATRMIRKGRWKLVNYDGMRPQLFDLEKDPHESDDLGVDAAYAQIRERLLAESSENWSPENARSTLEYRVQAQKLIDKWYGAVQPGWSIRWQPPADANKFPE